MGEASPKGGVFPLYAPIGEEWHSGMRDLRRKLVPMDLSSTGREHTFGGKHSEKGR